MGISPLMDRFPTFYCIISQVEMKVRDICLSVNGAKPLVETSPFYLGARIGF